MMKTLKLSLLGLLAVVVFFSCNNSKNAETKSADSTAVSVTPAQVVKKVEYPIPTPFEITEMLNKAVASYTTNLTNPVESVDKYFVEKKKAVNLGIYGADLCYASSYNMADLTSKYVANIKRLTEELGITSSINAGLVERVEKNTNNRDSLHSIISNSYYDTFDQLNKNQKGAVSVMVIAGGWIEGLYLSSQIQQNTVKNQEIVKGIVKQKEFVDKIITLLEQYKDNKDAQEVLVDFQKIQEAFKDVTGDTMNKKQLDKLTKAISTIRGAYVGL